VLRRSPSAARGSGFCASFPPLLRSKPLPRGSCFSFSLVLFFFLLVPFLLPGYGAARFLREGQLSTPFLPSFACPLHGSGLARFLFLFFPFIFPPFPHYGGRRPFGNMRGVRWWLAHRLFLFPPFWALGLALTLYGIPFSLSAAVAVDVRLARSFLEQETSMRVVAVAFPPSLLARRLSTPVPFSRFNARVSPSPSFLLR